MECLITIVLWVVDPVTNAVRLIFIKTCNDREYVVALISFRFLSGLVRIKDDSYGIEIIDLVICYALRIHLVPDRIRGFHSLLYLECESCCLESRVDRSYEFRYLSILICAVTIDSGCDFIECLRLLVSEPDVFHL